MEDDIPLARLVKRVGKRKAPAGIRTAKLAKAKEAPAAKKRKARSVVRRETRAAWKRRREDTADGNNDDLKELSEEMLDRKGLAGDGE